MQPKANAIIQSISRLEGRRDALVYSIVALQEALEDTTPEGVALIEQLQATALGTEQSLTYQTQRLAALAPESYTFDVLSCIPLYGPARCCVLVQYDGVWMFNRPAEKAALGEAINRLMSQPLETETITFTSALGTISASLVQLQGLVLECGNIEQAHISAQAACIEHAAEFTNSDEAFLFYQTQFCANLN